MGKICWNAVSDVAKNIAIVINCKEVVAKLLTIDYSWDMNVRDLIQMEHNKLRKMEEEVMDTYRQVMCGNTEEGANAMGYADDAETAMYEAIRLAATRH